MDTIEIAARVEQVLGPPDDASPAAGLGPERCARLVGLVLRTAPDPRLRAESWERSPHGFTVCVGSDQGVGLGLHFPAGERAGPDGGWVRCDGPAGAAHWRLGRRDAGRVWALLVRVARGRRARVAFSR